MTHSRLKLPLDLNDTSVCSVKKNMQLATLLKETNLIIWDESPMNDRRCFETLEKTLRDILDAPNKLFGSKTVMLGGNFRQTLPIKKSASQSEIISSSIAESYLWRSFKLFFLIENMRLTQGNLSKVEKEEVSTFTKYQIPDDETGLTKLINIISVKMMSMLLGTTSKYISNDKVSPHGHDGGEVELSVMEPASSADIVQQDKGKMGTPIQSNMDLKDFEYFDHLLQLQKAYRFLDSVANQQTQLTLPTAALSLALTLWNEMAQNFDTYEYDSTEKPVIIAVSSCYINRYNGLQLSRTSATHYYLNPNIVETYQIRQLYPQLLNTGPALDIRNQRDEDLERERTKNRFLLSTLLEVDPHNYQQVRFTTEATTYKINTQRRYIDTRPNGDALMKCILQGPYKLSTVIIPAQPATCDSPAGEEQTVLETLPNMSSENKSHYDAKKEAIHLILTRIRDEIYSTVDACKTSYEMWIAIERLQQGESLNKQDVKTSLFWEFGRFTSRDGETIESYYSRFYKMMNEMQTIDLDKESYHKLFDVLKQYHKEVDEIRAEKIARNANPLALVAATQQYLDTYYQEPKSHKHKGKEIAKPITPPSESASKEDSAPEQAQRDKDMQKNLAPNAKYFKKIYKPINNNFGTSSNTRNKKVDTSLRYKNDNQTGQYRNQRTVTVVGARETIGGQEFRKPKRAKDYTYHKEKMLMYKQAEKGVPLQAEQADWLEYTNEEFDKQELEAHYMYMAKIQDHPSMLSHWKRLIVMSF
ncbi:retrovirus-related pol polyprotein from transposon TNT 1-94 [Tanacetum coccineum]